MSPKQITSLKKFKLLDECFKISSDGESKKFIALLVTL